MENKRSGGIVTGFLGDSKVLHRRKDGIPDNTPTELDVQSSSKIKNICAKNENEHHKLHRLGSDIDWGASKFDFSNASTEIEIGTNALLLNDLAAISHEEAPVKKSSNMDINILSKIDENFKNDINLSKSCPKHTLFPPEYSHNMYTGRRHSLVDQNVIPANPPSMSPGRRHMVFDQNIEAVHQKCLPGDSFAASCLTNESMLKDNQKENSGIGGLMGGWFFRNKNFEEDGIPGTGLNKANVPVEGIGDGALTTKVISALNMDPTSKMEGEKMNTWMPTSF